MCFLGYRGGHVNSDSGTLQWLIGTLVLIFLAIAGAFGQVFSRISNVKSDLDKQVAETRTESRNGDEKLWSAHNLHVGTVASYREAIARELGGVAKKTDIDAMAAEFRQREERILAAIRGQTTH